MDLTREQRDLLHQINLRPNGCVLRSPESIAIMKQLCMTGALQDTYEMAGGNFMTSISPAGKKLLADTADFDPADHPDAGGPAGR